MHCEKRSLHEGWYLKVAASKIGNALDASAINKYDHLADIGLSSNPNGAGLAPKQQSKAENLRAEVNRRTGPGRSLELYCVLDEAGAIVLEQKLGTTECPGGSFPVGFWSSKSGNSATDEPSEESWRPLFQVEFLIASAEGR